MPTEFLFEPAPGLSDATERRPISQLMYLIWKSRPDVQAVFDIHTADGRAAFLRWFDGAAVGEYGLEPRNADVRTATTCRGDATVRTALKSRFGAEGGSDAKAGATLIGYAHGVLGMGEHVRMTATALAEANVPFGIVNVDGGVAKEVTPQLESYFVSAPVHQANIFHVNADQMLPTFCRLGERFFADTYNIGFWAWELANVPDQWRTSLEFVDEVWAPSRFIQQAFTEITRKPVTWMPLCVELPPITPRPRSYFGLPEGHTLFLYTFDSNSYIQRKNPFAAVRAFVAAFPDPEDPVGLVVKVMNADEKSEMWKELVALIGADKRIHLVNRVIPRDDLLALFECCDCFVSLHRSEGFGRGPAEAMYLGKPVIVTDYSGNTDFTRRGAALLVDYELVPVGPDEYLFGEGQVWADVDEWQAARHMRAVAAGGPEIDAIAKRGQQIIRTEFSRAAIGAKMKQRLREIGVV